jgi:dienelactone hydrolase
MLHTISVNTYFAYPESKQTEVAILLLTDVIGYDFINAQLIADQYAANGYYVVMPDLFEGDPVKINGPPGFDIMEWLQKSGPSGGHTYKQTDPIVEAVIQDMKTNQGVKKIGAVGYCFGAKYVARFMTGGKGVDVGYMAHPSFVEDEEIKALTGPLSISAAGALMLHGGQESAVLTYVPRNRQDLPCREEKTHGGSPEGYVDSISDHSLQRR